ncbi:hypothetical protein [Pleomorphomonas oryzae]|uniref:hypothetical protein n=1 Tax=Pleomorphomonas oryzae TaxID=261934 RepID=UPI00042A59DA|nr:hypothetical protein [Pleomorphomonas oryzae]
MKTVEHPKTPWQKVYAKLGMNAAELGRAMGKDRSKISRAVRDPVGRINGDDLNDLKVIAAARGTPLTIDDVTESVAENA